MNKQLYELAYFTSNVGGMAEFYKKLLGSDPVVESPDMAIFMIGDTKLFLHKMYTAEDGELPPENHTAFRVDNVDEECGKLVASGLTLAVEAKDYYWGRSAYLRDPDGHMIEITEDKPYE